ncbi:MAG TPA: hypothetical protein VF771_22015 [Longimicrobiaceae bacterium]
MARYERDPDLPDGVIPLPVEGSRQRSGCGVRGCMVAAVALFALLLVAMVALALLRPWQTPP